MSLTASDKGGADFEITPEGQYVARCFKIIDLGTQTTTGQFGTKEQHKVMISWELLDSEVQMADGRPYSVTQFYTVSLHEKSKLRADLESWRGKKFTTDELMGFDLSNVLGAYCMIQVVHVKNNDKTYANVQTIMAYKGTKPQPVNPDVVFDIDNPDMEVFNGMSDNMKAKIMSAPEWQQLPAPTAQAAPQPAVKAEPVKDAAPVAVDEVFPVEEKINLDEIPF